MPTSSFAKYNSGAEALVEGINAGTDTWRVILSNTTPAVTDVAQADAAELSTSGGYTVNGNSCAVSSSSQTSGVYKLVLADPTAWTASGGGFTARYAILWDQTADKLIGWWDYGSSQAVAAGETFTVDLSAANGVFTIT
jgi:hypothetical protein